MFHKLLFVNIHDRDRASLAQHDKLVAGSDLGASSEEWIRDHFSGLRFHDVSRGTVTSQIRQVPVEAR